MSENREPIPVPLSGLSVCLGLPVADRFAMATTVSLVETVRLLTAMGISSACQWQPGLSIVQKARNLVAHEFLKSEGFNRLAWIDADMAWHPQDFVRLLALSQEFACVGALGPIKTDDPRAIGLDPAEGSAAMPSAFFAVNLPKGEVVRREPYGVVKVDSMGLCFCCVHRDVMARLAERAPRFRHGGEQVAEIFRCETIEGEFRGEDRNFFDDVRALGVDAWLDPQIRLSHVGVKAYNGDLSQAFASSQVPRQPAIQD